MERTKLHPLETILSIVLLGVLAGVDSWTGFEEYAQDHQDTLKHFIDLSSGVPSHDTIARVISTLDVKAFERAFHRFTATLVEKFQGIIALDGKTLRGSFDHRKGVKARHIVSAWADCCPLVLAQVKVDDGSEFRDEFEQACGHFEIPLLVLPPSKPQYNGGVERSTLPSEKNFMPAPPWWQTPFQPCAWLFEKPHQHNTYRPHASLNGRTPWQSIQSSLHEDLSHIM
jgi:hypothetical protein